MLPILYDEEFAGRIEAVADRKAEILRIRHIWYEPGIRQTKKLQKTVDQAVHRLAAFNDCPEVAWEAAMI